MPLATQLIFYQTNFPGETIKQPFCRTRNFFSNFLQYPFPIKKKYTLVVEYLSLYTSILSLFLSLKRIFIKNFKILMILFKACPINIRIFSLFLNNIYISRLQEEIELFSSMERSPLELNRLVMEFACIKTDGRPSNLAKSLKSAGITWFCSPVHPPYCLVLARCSFARKIYRYTKLSIHHELPYRIFISLVSIGHCLTYR